MISKILCDEMDRYAERLRGTSRLLARAKAGEVSPGVVARYLVSIHYMLESTPIHLRRARERADALGHGRLADYFAEKSDAEAGHARWAENDMTRLSELTGKAAVDLPSQAVVDLARSVEQTIDAEPFLYLAHILFAENITVQLGPEWIAALHERCGIPEAAMTAVGRHVEIDRHHVVDGCREIDALVRDPGLHAGLVVRLHESMRHFSAFCDDLCDAA